MLAQLGILAQPVLGIPVVKRTRRNHGLEHATVHILSKRLKNVPMMGRSSDRGFVLFADAPQEEVESAVREALQRMQRGEHSLAIHPGCGTSRLTTGFLTSLVAIIGLSGTNRRDAFNRLPLMMVAMMLTILFSEPLGISLQKHFTTEGDPGNMEVISITRKNSRMPLNGQPTPMYMISFIRRDAMTKPIVTFYVLHGNDSLRLEEEVRKLRAQMGDSPDAAMNISKFEGETASTAEILNAALSYPFLADKRLVIVKDLLSWITRKGAGETGKQAVERLINVLPQLPEWSKLVFVERDKLPEGNKILKLARELPAGYEKSFTAPKDSTQWILKRAADEYQVQIDPRAAQALASVTGDDLRRADNELAKLVDYVNGERPISEEDVELLTPYVAEATAFQLVDAIAEGRGKAALDYLYRLLREKDEDPFKVYGMIIRQFRLMLLAKEHLTLTGSRAGLKEALNTSSDFVADKTAQQSRRFSLTELEEIYRALQDFDLKMKTGRIDPPLALDMFIAGLSR